MTKIAHEMKDDDGKPVADLKASDFVVLDNGVPQTVTVVTSYADEFVSRIEAGQHLPSLEVLERLATAYDLSLFDVLRRGGVEEG